MVLFSRNKVEKVVKEPERKTRPAKRTKIVGHVYYGHDDITLTNTDLDAALELYEEISAHIGQDYILYTDYKGNGSLAVNLKNYSYVTIEDCIIEV